MTGSGTFGIGGGARDYALRALALRAARPQNASHFHGERQDDLRGQRLPRQNGGGANSSRFETDGPPNWNGPRLNSAFVAQVLGQMLAKNRYERSALLAYGERGRALSLGCDLSA
jgi:hypothetical protein